MSCALGGQGYFYFLFSLPWRPTKASSKVPATRRQPPAACPQCLAAPKRKPEGPEPWQDPETSQGDGVGSSTGGVLAIILIC